MIKQAKEDSTIVDDEVFVEEAKNFSAFKSFTKLRSVRADNVTLIGNFAFADCTSLKEVIFPRVGHTASITELQSSSGYLTDIGRYAFLGCTDLKDVKFNAAAVIGKYAFKDCTSLSNIDFPEVWMIEKNAFEGCTNLTNVFFEKASKIGEEVFKNCTGLKKAEFNVNPARFTIGDPLVGGSPVYDSVIFSPSVFTGCRVLGVLNVRNAWNVYFSENALAYTGAAIEIHLFDESDDPDPGLSYGHPQDAMFLGDGASTTLKKVTILVRREKNSG